MNLAILIGISEYEQPGASLPACKNDLAAIRALSQASNHFDQIIVFDDSYTASRLKEKLSQEISKNQGEQIATLIFYFSGHGAFTDGDFRYVCKDFARSNINQASLSNEELDGMLRSLTPAVTIKIVDACHAGLSYIKSPSNGESYLQKTVGHFKKCYFMFSSQLDESSYQDEDLSFFTRSILEGIVNARTDEIRVKDLIDYSSDFFQREQWQRPLFVTQADFTEVFARRSLHLIEAVKPFLGEKKYQGMMTQRATTMILSLKRTLHHKKTSWLRIFILPSYNPLVMPRARRHCPP